MKEYNFFISIKYGIAPSLIEQEFTSTISSTAFDEDRLVETFREFLRHIRSELVRLCPGGTDGKK